MGVGDLDTDARHDFPLVIATTPATARQRKIAFSALAVLVVILAVTLPFASIELPRLDAFVPVVQTVMSIADLLTAAFLFAQYTVYPQRAVLVLASGFVFSGLFAFVQTLAFPGAYAPAGLIGNGDNSAAWLFQLWHTTFPLAVIVYTLSKDSGAAAIRHDSSTGVTIVVTIACVVTATAGLTLVATTLSGYLPDLFETATRQTPFSTRLSVPLSLLTVAALALLFIRKRTILDYWLIVTLLAWLPTLIVGVFFTVLRFTVGWYSARVYELCAGSSLLFVLLAETMVLYTRLAAAARIGALRRRELTATVTALEQSKLSLEQVNLWLDTALKNIAHGLSMFDRDQRLILCNERYSKMYNISVDQTRADTTLRDILEARGVAHAEDCARAFRVSEPTYTEIKLADGRTIAANYQPMPDGGWVAIHQDITERKKAEEHQQLLLSELDHRVRNVLARVAVVAMYTRQGSTSIDEFVRALDGRIQSMADAHALLSQNRWLGVGLADLVRRQLAPYTTARNTVISGPDITLSAAATQAVAMVLQELVTNAVKYGALSTSDGQVIVSWDHQPDRDGATRLAIAWQETGGPPANADSRSSYGTSLIRGLIPRELGGTVNLVLGPDGACCDIQIPLEARIGS
jgi:two-component sensor histidine kinase/PAS domain-containing protein